MKKINTFLIVYILVIVIVSVISCTNPTQLPQNSIVTLTIYDILGQEIKILINGIQEAGYRHIEWNATNIASGIYFYRIEATSVLDPSKSFTQVRKMILLR